MPTPQTTLIILKPDTVHRGLMGPILTRFETKGLRVVGGKFMQVSEELARKHYAEHEGKPFFEGLIGFITSTPVMVLALYGPRAVAVCRNLIGITDGKTAVPGTIRGDFGISGSMNLVHGSDSPESAKRELKLWFAPDEFFHYDRAVDPWISG